jgi:hypothetical protein
MVCEVSVDSVIFANSSQTASVKDVRVVVKVSPAKSVTERISLSVVRVRWLGSRMPRHSLAVVFVDANQTSQRVTVPSAPVIIIEVWGKNAKTLLPHIVGIVRCPVRADKLHHLRGLASPNSQVRAFWLQCWILVTSYMMEQLPLEIHRLVLM